MPRVVRARGVANEARRTEPSPSTRPGSADRWPTARVGELAQAASRRPGEAASREVAAAPTPHGRGHARREVSRAEYEAVLEGRRRMTVPFASCVAAPGVCGAFAAREMCPEDARHRSWS